MNDENQNKKNNMVQNWAVSMRQNVKRHDDFNASDTLKYSHYNIIVKLKDKGVLLFNSVTKALSRLTFDESVELLQWHEHGASHQNSNASFTRSLQADGFLVAKARNEVEASRDAYFATRNNKTNMVLTVAPTMSCNLACGYCFQGLDKDLTKLDKNVPNGILDFVKSQTATLKSLNMTWYGGEPLMAKKDIFSLADRLISHCDMNGIQYSSSIVTNGYFLTTEVAEQLWTRRCTSAQVTVDGEEATHDKMRPLTSGRGSFKVIINNITEVLEKTPLHIALRVNVGRQNVTECNRLLEDFERRGFAKSKNFTVYFAPIDAATTESGTAFEDALGKKEFNEFVVALGSRAREMGLAPPIQPPSGIMGMCVAAFDNGYVITHNGDIHKCWETAHDPSKRVGSIFEPEEIKHSLNSEVWSSWSPFDSDVCKACKILPMCGGFCGHRYIYQGLGDDQALPCPDWKWNTAEYLFARAKHVGVVNDADWDPQEASADRMQAGERHTTDSLRAAQATVFKKVSENRGELLDVDNFLYGEKAAIEGQLNPIPLTPID